MKNLVLKKKIEEVEKYLQNGEYQKAQIQMEELQNKIKLVDILNSPWLTSRTDFKQKDALELNFEFKQLENATIVIQENFDKNVKALKELGE